MDRRTFLRVSAVSAAGIWLPVKDGKGEAREAQAADANVLINTAAKPSSWITPNDEFYVQDITAGEHPHVDVEKWKLIVNGLVRKAKLVTFDDVLALPAVTTERTLACIGDPVGGEQIGNAVWKGIRVSDLLADTQPRDAATRVVFKSSDGYTTGIPIADALHEDAVLAYEMNGEPLPRAHGYPLRFLNPGKYGQKCPKWIIGVELVAREYLGYWESKGWDDTAAVRMATRINQPAAGDALPAHQWVRLRRWQPRRHSARRGQRGRRRDVERRQHLGLGSHPLVASVGVRVGGAGRGADGEDPRAIGRSRWRGADADSRRRPPAWRHGLPHARS